MRTKTMTVVTLLSLILAGTAFAQPLPSLKILVPANPGGGWDQTARVIEQALRAEKLVTGAMRLTNRGGAGGTIGLAEFAKSKGEGGSLMVMGLVMVGAILTNKSPVTLESVTPIARLTSEYLVIAVPESSKIRTLRDLTEALKKDPGAVPIVGGSRGGSDHMLAALVAEAVGAVLRWRAGAVVPRRWPPRPSVRSSPGRSRRSGSRFSPRSSCPSRFRSAPPNTSVSCSSPSRPCPRSWASRASEGQLACSSGWRSASSASTPRPARRGTPSGFPPCSTA